MKVTRLRGSYRISLTAGDLEMLNALVVDGLSTYEGDDTARDEWSPMAKAAFTRRVKQVSGNPNCILRLDESRR